MKKILYLLFAFAVPVLFAACSDDDNKPITPELSFETPTVTASPVGGMYEAKLLCNTSWKVTAQSSNITDLNKKEGTGNVILQFVVGPKTADNTTPETIVVKTTGAGSLPLTAILMINQDKIAVSFESSDATVSSDGGTVTAKLLANTAWTVTQIAGTFEGVVQDQSGDGNHTFSLVIGANQNVGSSAQYSFTVSAKGSAPTEPITATFTVNQGEPVVVLGGVSYKIVKMDDGRWWMAENVRFIPNGITSSGDPTANAGMWYTANLDKEPQTAPDSVAKYGYLYTPVVALTGGVAITEANYESFEGRTGLCPEGWYIPTETDAKALIAAYHDPDQDLVSSDAASIDSLNGDGFNGLLCGMRMQNTSLLTGAYSPGTAKVASGYLMLSTGSMYSVKSETGAITSKNKVMSFMKNATVERLFVSDQSNYAGSSVRCIKAVQ